MKKKLFVCISFVIILGLPCLISYVLSCFNIHNEWIAFWGSYLGGFFTLIGVALTIRHSKRDADEKQRLSIMPYLTIKKDETKTDEIIGLSYCFTEQNKENRYIYFDDLKINGNGVNVGLGPLVNCAIKDIKVENRVIDSNTREASIVTNNDGINFKLEFISMAIEEKDMTDDFIKNYSLCWHSGYMHTPPFITVEFYFYYEDVMGEKYKQKVEYQTQIVNEDLTITEPVRMGFKKIYKPERI